MSDFATARVESVFLAERADDFYSEPRESLTFDLDGIAGDQRHRGRTMVADVRIKPYQKGQDEVLNRQTVSVIDSGSLDVIADSLELDSGGIEERYGVSRRTFLAQCIGANILFDNFRGSEQIPEFYDTPNATDVGPYCPDTNKFSAAALMVTRYNSPCIHPGKKIEAHYPKRVDGLAQRFVQAAEGRRGFVAMVVKPGVIAVNDEVMFRPLPSAS